MEIEQMSDKERRWLAALKEFRAVLDEVDFPYFIDTGTLLGAIRDKRFIAWDNDIDFGTIRDADTHNKLNEASDILLGRGYSYARTDQGTYFVKDPDIEFGIMFYERKGDYFSNEFRKLEYPFGMISHVAYLAKMLWSGFIVDYGGHSLGKKARHLLMQVVGKRPFRPERQFSKLFNLEIKEINIPARFFDNPMPVQLYGESYPAPYPPEDYLSCRYGDWRTPVSKYNYWVEDRSIVT